MEAFRQSDTIAVPVVPCQRPCPLRRCAPRPGCGTQRLLRCRLHPAGRCPNSSSLFPPLAAVVAVAPRGGALGFAGCKSLSLWERWHCEAMTERASPTGQSCHAAISRPFVRAILSLCLRFLVSGLALSGAARQGRVAAPSVCFAVACILLAAAPTAPPCFRRWRRSSPLPPKGEPLRKTKTAPSRKIPRWSGDIQEMLSRRC